MLTKKIALILSALLVIFFTIFVLYGQQKSPITALENTKALIGGPFSLTNHHGEKVTEKDFKGKYMLIYFGYTYCPDVCPTELQIMSDALDRLPANISAEITPIFITVDPDRDTVDIMAQYVHAFHPKLVGLTGTDEQINAVKKAYRVYGAKEPSKPEDDKDSYLVSHTSYIYLMDRNGEFVTHFSSQSDPQSISLRLKETVR